MHKCKIIKSSHGLDFSIEPQKYSQNQIIILGRYLFNLLIFFSRSGFAYMRISIKINKKTIFWSVLRSSKKDHNFQNIFIWTTFKFKHWFYKYCTYRKTHIFNLTDIILFTQQTNEQTKNKRKTLEVYYRMYVALRSDQITCSDRRTIQTKNDIFMRNGQ